MRWRVIPMLALVGVLSLPFAHAIAGGVVVTIIDGHKAKADITLPNPGGGSYTAEFEIEFEAANLQNLTVACIGITADVLDASEIIDVQQRLPHRKTQFIDPAFPVRVTVEPPAGCGLAFDNQYDVSLDTDDLVFAPYSAYRLVKAPIGGQFKYVTAAVTAGSVRVRGRTGGFSEFVVLRDDAPDYYTDCVTTYGDVQTRLQNSAISLSARHALEIDLAVSLAAYDVGDFDKAITALMNFIAHCRAYGGEALPNRWRSARDLDNIEGDLVGKANDLLFMLNRLNGSP